MILVYYFVFSLKINSKLKEKIRGAGFNNQPKERILNVTDWFEV